MPKDIKQIAGHLRKTSLQGKAYKYYVAHYPLNRGMIDRVDFYLGYGKKIKDSQVDIYIEFCYGGTTHPNAFISNALSSDPARRLAFGAWRGLGRNRIRGLP